METHKEKVEKTLKEFKKLDSSIDALIDTTGRSANWLNWLKKKLKE